MSFEYMYLIHGDLNFSPQFKSDFTLSLSVWREEQVNDLSDGKPLRDIRHKISAFKFVIR